MQASWFSLLHGPPMDQQCLLVQFQMVQDFLDNSWQSLEDGDDSSWNLLNGLADFFISKRKFVYEKNLNDDNDDNEENEELSDEEEYIVK